jgi:hypothetical protein
LERLMPSPYDAQELPRLRAEFASLSAEFRHWLCWPDPSGGWYALELRFWFRDTDEVHLIKAGSPAGVRAWLRGFEEHAHAWQAARLAAGLPAADPPVPDLPLAAPATLDTAALAAAMRKAANGLTAGLTTTQPVPGLPVPGRPAAAPPWSVAAGPGGRRRHRRRPSGSRAGRTHREPW